MMFWLTHHRFHAPFQGWSEKYLSSKEYRITYLVRHDLGNDYWQNYSQVIEEFVREGHLLFRAKVSISDAIEFIQIWKSEAYAVEFEKRVEKKGSPIQVLTRLGFKIEVTKRLLSQGESQEMINEVTVQSSVIQYLNKPFVLTQGYVLGDPLKVNNGHLPFSSK